MKKDTIITLEDNTKYVLLDKIKKDKTDYFFAIKLDKLSNPTTDYEIFEVENNDEGTYVNSLDEEIKESIFLEFSNKFIKSIEKKEDK